MDYTIGRGWAIGVQGVVEMGCTNIWMGGGGTNIRVRGKGGGGGGKMNNTNIRRRGEGEMDYTNIGVRSSCMHTCNFLLRYLLLWWLTIVWLYSPELWPKPRGFGPSCTGDRCHRSVYINVEPRRAQVANIYIYIYIYIYI